MSEIILSNFANEISEHFANIQKHLSNFGEQLTSLNIFAKDAFSVRPNRTRLSDEVLCINNLNLHVDLQDAQKSLPSTIELLHSYHSKLMEHINNIESILLKDFNIKPEYAISYYANNDFLVKKPISFKFTVINAAGDINISAIF